MGLPSNGSVCDFQNYVIRDLVDRYSDEIEFIFPEQLCQRIFHDAAREGIVQDFLDSKADILWFLDSDIVPTKNVLDLLTLHGDKWQTAGAPYPVFMAQPGESHRQVLFTMYKAIEPHPVTKQPRLQPTECPTDGTALIDGIATGCLFIKREVFDKLERPYFEFKYDPVTRMPIEGEDIGFCLKLHKLGIKFFVDYSMPCKHYKNNIDLLEINNYAMAYAQKCVNYQRKVIEEQIKPVEEKYNKLKAQNKELREALRQIQEQIARPKPGANRQLIFK